MYQEITRAKSSDIYNAIANPSTKMPRWEPELSLRVIVLLARAWDHEGIPAAETLSHLNVRKPTTGRGTPGRSTTSYDARSPATNTPLPTRQYRNVTLTAHTPLPEAVRQLCRLLEPHATQQAANLALSLATLIETERLLASFSTAVAAVVCINVSAFSLNLEPLLSNQSLFELGILADSVRIAYNQLWVERGVLEGVIWHEGGDPFLLPSPKRADGSLDRETFCRGVGFPIPAVEVVNRNVRQPRGVAVRRFEVSADDIR